jgi:hypothetical protein
VKLRHYHITTGDGREASSYDDTALGVGIIVGGRELGLIDQSIEDIALICDQAIGSRDIHPAGGFHFGEQSDVIAGLSYRLGPGEGFSLEVDGVRLYGLGCVLAVKVRGELSRSLHTECIIWSNRDFHETNEGIFSRPVPYHLL